MKPYFDYLHLREKVNPAKNLIAVYQLKPKANEAFEETAGGIAAESSVGTWTEVTTELKNVWEALHARVFEIDKPSGLVKIAYPLDLFEPGNIPQLLSSVAGNVFGLKEIDSLKLLDLDLPEKYVKSFSGPAVGLEGIRKKIKVFNRPLIGSIIKPKLGLSTEEHLRLAIDVFEAGLDFVKDDENLTNQNFNKFSQRANEILKKMKESNLKHKIYAFNITAPSWVMKERAELVKKNGGNCVMIDFLTTGFGSLQTLRNENYDLIIHAHRAMHAALSRGAFGVSMLVLAKIARLAGVDSLHTGTVIGKMEGEKKEVLAINNFLRSEWYGLKKVLPVASGGLYPKLIPQLIKILGKEIMFNFGGGIHGHPLGSKAGAQAVVQAVEAVQKGIALENYAKERKELKIALDLWK